MNIERSCRITLTPSEVMEALTDYVQEKYRYRTDKIKAVEECLSWGLGPDMQAGKSIIMVWGVPLEPEETSVPSTTAVPEPAIN